MANPFLQLLELYKSRLLLTTSHKPTVPPLQSDEAWYILWGHLDLGPIELGAVLHCSINYGLSKLARSNPSHSAQVIENESSP